MQNFTTTKDAQIVDISGLVNTESAQNAALQSGDNIPSGTVLTFAEGSEITLAFADGTHQTITGAADETLATNDQATQQTSAAAITEAQNSTVNAAIPTDVQADIEAIQASIESGDDIDLPDTTAGGLTGNEGTDFVTLDRDGNELLAGAGVDTTELDNPIGAAEEPELFARNTQPTITESDTNSVAEDTTASGNVLDNDSDADDDLTVESFTVAGDPALYTSGQTAIVEGGSLIVSQDGSYSFVPAENFNGDVPVVTYTTNTNASDTLSIILTPVNDTATVSSETKAVSEGDLATDLNTNGKLTITDADSDQTVTWTASDLVGTYGTFTVAADGTWSYAGNDAHNELNVNDTVSDQITVTSADGTTTGVIKVNITGTNDAATVSSETKAVSEGDLATDLNTNGKLTITDVDSDQTVTWTASDLVGTYGTFTVAADGTWSYAGNDAHNELNVNDTVSDQITVASADGTATGVIKVNITGTNDAATVSSETKAVSEGDLATDLNTNGKLTITDADSDQTVTWTASDLVGTYGTFTVAADGTWSYAGNDAHNELNVNDTVSDQITVTSADGTATGVIKVNITGTNDAATVSSETKAVSEGDLATDLNTNGKLTITDADSDQTVTWTASDLVGTYGTFTVAADGTWSYAGNDAHNELNVNDTVSDQITVTSADGTATGVIKVNITGTNDAATVSSETKAVSEGDLATDLNTNGKLTITDADSDQTVTWTASDLVGTYGTFTVAADGTWSYAGNDAHNELNVNDTVSDQITVTSADGTATGVIKVNITGTNDAATVSSETKAVSEGDLATDLNTNGKLTITDVDSDQTVTWTASDLVGTYGTFTVAADGTWSYAGNDAHNELNVNDTVSDQVTVTSADGTATGVIKVNITGTNDAPVAEDDSFIVDDGAKVSGNVITHNDGDNVIDIDGDNGATLKITEVNGTAISGDAIFTIIDGVLNEVAVSPLDDAIFVGTNDNGILTINESGAFTYENKGFLEADGSTPPSFEYTLSDGTDTDTARVTINVNTNAPTANDDLRFIVLEDGDQGAVGGNVTGIRGSSGDEDDISVDGFGSPRVTEVIYGTDAPYLFTDTITTHIIETNYGTMKFYSTGNYEFLTTAGLSPLEDDIDLEFTYTIQDGDALNPETHDATLTINIASLEANVQAKALDIDLNQNSGTIDTDFDSKALINVNEAAFKYSPNLDDLSDILTDGYTGGLETYFAAMGEDESAMVDIDLAVALKDFQVDDSVVLEKGDANSEHAAFTTVTNGFLADGAIIISDTAEATSAPIAELDSQEFLS